MNQYCCKKNSQMFRNFKRRCFLKTLKPFLVVSQKSSFNASFFKCGQFYSIYWPLFCHHRISVYSISCCSKCKLVSFIHSNPFSFQCSRVHQCRSNIKWKKSEKKSEKKVKTNQSYQNPVLHYYILHTVHYMVRLLNIWTLKKEV